jgi:signal transduction histidine kinase
VAPVGEYFMEQMECREETPDTPGIIAALVQACSSATDYRTLRDLLPGHLAALLRCRCVLLYLRMEETLQFASGSFDDKPGWSTALLTVAHINPIALQSDVPEAHAWRARRLICTPQEQPVQLSAPLLYRQHVIGVLTAIHVHEEGDILPRKHWPASVFPLIEATASIVALLLENMRLLERDRERIRELSLLNNISDQLHGSPYEHEHIRRIVTRQASEIAHLDFCEMLEAHTLSPTHAWLTPDLFNLLLQHFQAQSSSDPLLLERPGGGNDSRIDDYLVRLPLDIKTFFAVPLISGRIPGHRSGLMRASGQTGKGGCGQGRQVPGILVGGHYRAYKLRHEEVVLLQMLAHQVGTALENMSLMAEVEEEKRRLDRLASLGEMAANVAHEVRNPLASIKASMLMLRDDLTHYHIPTSDETQESVTVVLEEVERLDAIVRDLLLFARPRQLHRITCDIAELCDRVLDLLKNTCLEANVVVRRTYEDVPPLWIDVGQIEQVLINLCMNAIQAMPDGGELTVSCSKNDDGVDIAISDTGMGISPQQARRIFQPFFTTKAHGIGLGLAISKRLVEDHGGSIRVAEDTGNGAAVIVYLPARRNSPQID